MVAGIQAPEVDRILEELLDHEEPAVVDWAGLGLGKRKRVDLIGRLEKAAARIGKAPRLTWAIDHLKKVKEKGPVT
jgi:hypothetical protein